MIFKTDQEPAIVALRERIIESLGTKVEVISEESPVDDHQGNGEIENAIKELEKQIRVLKDSVERKMQLVIKDDHPVMAWIPQHAGFLLSRFQVAADGKTAHERLKGKAYRREMVDFAERVVFMPVVLGGKMNKLESKWEPGRFIGVRPKSNEALVMTERGVLKARTMRRLPKIDRWVKDDWEELKGLPWAWKPAKPRLPGVSPIPVSDAPPPPAGDAREEEKRPRRRYIKATDIEDYGYTPGCPACKKILEGTPGAVGKTHNEKCRARIYKAIDEAEANSKRRLEEKGDEDPERVRRRLEDQEPQVGERSPAAGSGSRKRPAEESHEHADKERSERAEAAEASSSRKREAEIPVQQADEERRQQLYREGGSAGSLTQVGGRPPAAVRVREN